MMNSDKCIPTYLFDKNFEVSIPHRTEWENSIEFNEEDIVTYTDGSKMEQGTGAGIHSMKPLTNVTKPLGKYTTITQAEIYAIIEICTLLSEKNTRNQKIHICTDSQASLKALKRHCFTSKLTIECISRIQSLAESNDVNLIWVPGHSNITGNEKADNLAREGSNTAFIGPEPVTGLPYSTQRSIIRNFYAKKHKLEWVKLNSCRHSKNFIKEPNKKMTNYLLSISRSNLRLVIGTITGHCKLNKHLHRMKLSNSPLCRHCNEADETPEHFLTSCPALAHRRQKFLEQPFPQKHQLETIGIGKIHKLIRSITEMQIHNS